MQAGGDRAEKYGENMQTRGNEHIGKICKNTGFLHILPIFFQYLVLHIFPSFWAANYTMKTYQENIGKLLGKHRENIGGSPQRLVKYAGQYWENIGTVKNIVTNMQTGEKHTLGKYAPPSPKVLPKSVVISLGV